MCSSFVYGAFTLYGRTAFPDRFDYHAQFVTPRSPCGATQARAVPQPRLRNACQAIHVVGLGCSHFARHYSGNRDCCFLFLSVLRCFTSPVPSSHPMCSGAGDRVTKYTRRVSPFGHPRIIARLRLPEAYRSLPRPSSALRMPRHPPYALSSLFSDVSYIVTSPHYMQFSKARRSYYAARVRCLQLSKGYPHSP